MYEVPSFILGIYIGVLLLQSGELIAISSDEMPGFWLYDQLQSLQCHSYLAECGCLEAAGYYFQKTSHLSTALGNKALDRMSVHSVQSLIPLSEFIAFNMTVEKTSNMDQDNFSFVFSTDLKGRWWEVWWRLAGIGNDDYEGLDSVTSTLIGPQIWQCRWVSKSICRNSKNTKNISES